MTPSDVQLALKWGCDLRTIRRWRKAGAPLTAAKDMAAWLAGRKNLPPGTAAILSGQLSKAMGAVACASETENAGAAGALTRLESAERVTYRMLQSALKSGNPSGIKTARENWLTIGDSLRRYDRQVARDRRDAGELVPRSEMEAHAANFIYWLRMATRQTTHTMMRALSEHPNPTEAGQALMVQLWDNTLSALAAGASRPCKAQLPAWWIGAAMEGAAGAFRDPASVVAARQASLEAVFKALVSATAERRLEYLAELVADSKKKEPSAVQEKTE